MMNLSVFLIRVLTFPSFSSSPLFLSRFHSVYSYSFPSTFFVPFIYFSFGSAYEIRLKSISFDELRGTKVVWEKSVKQRVHPNKTNHLSVGCCNADMWITNTHTHAYLSLSMPSSSLSVRWRQWWPTKESISIMINDQNWVYFLFGILAFGCVLPVTETQCILA